MWHGSANNGVYQISVIYPNRIAGRGQDYSLARARLAGVHWLDDGDWVTIRVAARMIRREIRFSPSSGAVFVGNSVFLDFRLPNGPTWFYMSAILAIALFFKFNRVLSLRNWDLLTLFLLVPGLLLLTKAAPTSPDPDALLSATTWWAYVWLLGGSAYYFGRCLLDLVIIRRPALNPI